MGGREDEACEVVLSVGAEGGGLTLFLARTAAGQIEHFTRLSAQSFEDIPGVDRTSSRVAAFDEALALLDEEPDWVRLIVTDVHPDYAARILDAVESRLRARNDGASLERALERWRRRCTEARES